MPRSFTYSALTLRVKASGESNREAWFLTTEEGVIRATVFGGPKSKLRSHVAPFHEGKLWIYHDPVRDTRKASDFDVFNYRTGIRELYERSMAASAVSETILCSDGGGGNWQEAARLAGSVLDALAAAGKDDCPEIAVYFFWHWAGILGVRPDISADISFDISAGVSGSAGRIAHNEDFPFRLDQGTRRWLMEIQSAEAASLQAHADPECLEQAKNFTKAILSGALGRRLPTWDEI